MKYLKIAFMFLMFLIPLYSNIDSDIQVELLKTQPDPVLSNSQFNASILITNKGSVAHTLIIKQLYNSFFYNFGPSPNSYLPLEDIGIRLEPNQSKEYSFSLLSKDLILGKNPLSIYIQDANNPKDYSIKTLLINSKLDQKYVDIFISNYTQGDNFIFFNLILTSQEDIYNLQINLDVSNIPIMLENNDNVVFIPEFSKIMIIPINVSYDSKIPSGIYNIPLSLQYEDKNKNQFVSQTFIPIKLDFKDQIILGKISSVPSKLTRDTKMNKIILEISNSGNDEVKNLVATLKIDSSHINPSYFGSDKISLGYFNPSSTKNAYFFFDIDKYAQGDIPATLFLEYTFKSKRMNKSIPFNVHISNAPYFEVRQETYEKNNNEIHFFVKNIGDSCDDVEVIGLTKNLPISWYQNSDKAAKLDENQEEEFVLNFKFTSLAVSKKYAIPIRIRCVYNNEPVVQDEQIYVVSEAKGDKNYMPFIAIGLFIIAILFLVGKYFFKRDKK